MRFFGHEMHQNRFCFRPRAPLRTPLGEGATVLFLTAGEHKSEIASQHSPFTSTYSASRCPVRVFKHDHLANVVTVFIKHRVEFDLKYDMKRNTIPVV